jgi:hypothetical protein
LFFEKGFVWPQTSTSILVLTSEQSSFELDFSGSKSDTPLFIFNSAKVRLFALVYVDDIILTGSSISVMGDLIRSLSLTLPIKDLGSLNFFLGVEVHWSSTGLYLSQQRYIVDILKRTNMELAKPISSPMSTAAPLSKLDGISMADPTIYHSTVGALQYLSITRHRFYCKQGLSVC